MVVKVNKKESFFKALSIALSVLVVISLVLIVSNIFSSSNNSDNNNKMDSNIVVMKTSMGDIEIELFLEKSPITAGNFKQLVEKGFYDGIKFHRVIPDFMIQGGDPLSKNDSLKKRWGTGGAERIEDEFITGLSNVRGSLSMANSGPNSGSSQFFINTKDNTFLDWDKAPAQSKHPVFAKVISGMDIVDKISMVRKNAQDMPLENVVIIKAYMK